VRYTVTMPRILQAISVNFIVTITDNSRIKIWRIEDLRHSNNVLANLLIEALEHNHLELEYTSIAILEEVSLLALGDHKGRIVLFNLKTGKKNIGIVTFQIED